MPEFNTPKKPKIKVFTGNKGQPNKAVMELMAKFRGERSILQLSQETDITRITLTAWSRGQAPDPGVLLMRYLDGGAESKRLSYSLLMLVRPDIVQKLKLEAVSS